MRRPCTLLTTLVLYLPSSRAGLIQDPEKNPTMHRDFYALGRSRMGQQQAPSRIGLGRATPFKGWTFRSPCWVSRPRAFRMFSLRDRSCHSWTCRKYYLVSSWGSDKPGYPCSATWSWALPSPAFPIFFVVPLLRLAEEPRWQGYFQQCHGKAFRKRNLGKWEGWRSPEVPGSVGLPEHENRLGSGPLPLRPTMLRRETENFLSLCRGRCMAWSGAAGGPTQAQPGNGFSRSTVGGAHAGSRAPSR